MSKITTNIAGKTITISISGKFNSLLHTEFYKESWIQVASATGGLIPKRL